jgi:hypothetical protein
VAFVFAEAVNTEERRKNGRGNGRKTTDEKCKSTQSQYFRLPRSENFVEQLIRKIRL